MIMNNITDGSNIERLVCERSDSLSVRSAVKLSITGAATLPRYYNLMSSLGTLSLCAENYFVVLGLLFLSLTAVIIFCAIEDQ